MEIQRILLKRPQLEHIQFPILEKLENNLNSQNEWVLENLSMILREFEEATRKKYECEFHKMKTKHKAVILKKEEEKINGILKKNMEFMKMCASHESEIINLKNNLRKEYRKIIEEGDKRLRVLQVGMANMEREHGDRVHTLKKELDGTKEALEGYKKLCEDFKKNDASKEEMMKEIEKEKRNLQRELQEIRMENDSLHKRVMIFEKQYAGSGQ